MACLYPLTGYLSNVVNPSGKRSIVFDFKRAFTDVKITVPCGQCIGCRLDRSRQWASRIMHEASMYEDNCFLTLTYNDDNHPVDGSLNKKHFQLFLKRLRKFLGSVTCKQKFPSLYNRKIKYFHCGEYGEKFSRPHYHAILFNIDFPDKVLFTRKHDCNYYTSDLLNWLWRNVVTGVTLGHCIIGDLTYDSAAYVARYCTKKITGNDAKDHYCGLTPEYCTMSLKPAISSEWIDKYSNDVLSVDGVVINGKVLKSPKYYDKKLKLEHYEKFDNILNKRRKEVRKYDLRPSSDLRSKRINLKQKFKQLKRGFENDTASL